MLLISCRLIAALLNISNQEAEIKEIGMIGPATVGGIKTTPWKSRQTRLCGLQWKSVFLGPRPGCIRIGNTGEVTRRPMVDGLLTDAGGMLDNVVMSRLYRPGSVSEPSSFVVFLLQVNVHMTIRLRDIFGALQLSDYQLARCVMLLPEVAYVSKSGGMSNELVCQTCICACKP